MRGFVGAGEERIERRREASHRFANLQARERAVLVARRVAMPEVDVPARELTHALETVRIGAPVLARERDVAAIDGDALLAVRSR